MKRKLRIFSNIAIIALSVCMFAFGVYAASTVSVTTSGTVSFVAEGVYATVTRTVTGNTGNDITNGQTTIGSDTTSPVVMGNNESLEFEDAQTPIVMSFKIKNEATEEGRDLYVKVADNGSTLTANDNVTKIVDNLGMYFSIAPQTEVTVDILLMVADPNKSAAAEYDYIIYLQSAIDGYYELVANDSNWDYDDSGNWGPNFSDEVKAQSKIIIKSNTFEDNTIPSELFKDNTTLTNIVLPNTITSIDGSAFKNCTNLVELAIPTSLVNLGYGYYSASVLEGCTSLTALYLPTGLQTVGDSCIYDLTNLETLIIKSTNLTVVAGNFCASSGVSGLKLKEITLINPEKFEFEVGIFSDGGLGMFERINIIKPNLTLQGAWNIIFNGFDASIYGGSVQWGFSNSAKKIYYNNTLIEDILFPENFTLADHYWGFEYGVAHYKTVYMNSTFNFASTGTPFDFFSDTHFYIDSQSVYDLTKINADDLFTSSWGGIFNALTDASGTMNILKSIVDADTNKESLLLAGTNCTKVESTVTYNGQEYYRFENFTL